ncbi:hypothetical protein [Nocardia huaxiensis]|uniref:Uncharacterized protein n=1 Tax=Nocardia huaxiensis TaxID=2755382 RepID=A0A7D6VHX0_9NOCA|nr:hypothetical protein [Nocardia huaxiensis]QLY30356.1 hypothetical protein H0264_35395 [Nocardia huaxiensis]UFS96007.1 hypothetical protein LPY97_36050 [Nocardia huaxiensis]
MIGKFESNKDLIQELTSSGARHVGNIATIITGTVAEVTREIGDWITDAIEMREAAAAAAKDAAAQRAADDLDAADDDIDDTPDPVAPQPDPVVKTAEYPTADVIDAEVVYPREP